ncbi:hypothetical protein BRC65_08980 [Halobacteriales archaeon QH_2_65_14]|nr:MAG: hypothetical protein BRC65_08980 [Halobacteriales archaeon QH_2_65_14]
MDSDRWPLQTVRLPPALEALAFWTAIVLPTIYVPLLFLGLYSLQRQLLFVLLLVLNALTILLGQGHRRARTR